MSDSFELRVFLTDPRAPFGRVLNDQARLRFVLRRRGDCGTPFEGDGRFEIG